MRNLNIIFFVFVISGSALISSSCKKDADTPINNSEKYINLTLPDTSGSLLSISDYEGSYILVEFWASWCGPCRIENPNLVSLFDQYKNKNFIIFGVSLDTEHTNWQNAIEDDMLNWPNVSDLEGWNSESVDLYNVQFTPSNHLVNPDGIIIATNLKGSDLADKLSELLD